VHPKPEIPEVISLTDSVVIASVGLPEAPPPLIIEKTLLYEKHLLTDTFPYRDTVRVFQWGKIRDHLTLFESIRKEPASWAILQNYRNKNGEAPLVRNFVRDAYKRVADTLGIERFQSVPLFLPDDSLVAERYGRDGTLVRRQGVQGSFVRVEAINFSGQWLVPSKYLKPVADSVEFRKAIFVDRTNQNLASLELIGSKWLVRSMNPITTGMHKPPYAQETPLGIFMLQEKKVKMIFLKDGSVETGGFAPYASRFTNGAYIHGIPVNLPQTKLIEFSASLGTVPRSHMCVRSATSHAQFIFDWAGVEETLIFIIE
jgi:hypothetical protein